MKNILFVQNTADLGGATVRLLQIIDGLDRAKYNPSVILLADGLAVRLLRERGINVSVHKNISTYNFFEGAHYSFRTFRPWYPITKILQVVPSSIRFYKILSNLDIDLIHINTTTQIPSLIGSYFCSVKCVFHVREVLLKGNFGIRRKIIQLIINKCADVVICIASHNANQLLNGEKYKTIYDSIDFKLFNTNVNKKKFRLKNSIKLDVPTIGFLGGIIPHKGLHILIKASETIKRKYPQIKFIVAGSKPKPQPNTFKRKIRHIIEQLFKIKNHDVYIEQLLKKYNANDNFIFTGGVIEVYELIASLNVLVFPITESHFGGPIIEAMSMKIPVVASDFPSNREVIIDNETGLLADPSDHEDLAMNIIRVLDNKIHTDYMVENAYEYVRKDFDLCVNIKKIFNIYDDLLHEK